MTAAAKKPFIALRFMFASFPENMAAIVEPACYIRMTRV
jgi:hypothetical protein